MRWLRLFKIDVNQFEEELEALQQLIFLGAQVKEAIPQLHVFKVSTLGLLQLLSHEEYPGSRNATRVNAPSSNARPEIVDTLTFLLYFWVCLSFKDSYKLKFVNSNILRLVIERVLLGQSELANVSEDYDLYARFENKIDKQSQFMLGLDQWQHRTARLDELRSTGKYLYVKEAISPEKPAFLNALFSQARSRPYETFLATQTLADFAMPLHPK